MSASPKRSSTTARTHRARSSNDTRQRLAVAIDRMPRRDRQVLNLILVEGLNEHEVAQAIGIEAPMVRRGFVALLRKLQRVAGTVDVQTPGGTGSKTRATRLRRAS